MRAQTRTSAKITLTVLKSWYAGEPSTAILFSLRISILSSKDDTLALRVRVAIVVGW